MLCRISLTYCVCFSTVRRNLGKAKEEVNNLYKKKKQLENLKIQKGLEAKLRSKILAFCCCEAELTVVLQLPIPS